jgi:hypothetical protein
MSEKGSFHNKNKNKFHSLKWVRSSINAYFPSSFLLCNLLYMASVYRSKSNQGLERKGQNDVYYGQLRANKREENTIERHQNEISGNMNLISRKYCTLFFVFRLKY